jgi:predicted neutral ceramidase superfamily lipid hydrolase
VYIKYVEVQSLTQATAAESRVSHTFNKVTLSVGLTSCVGLDIVANFQESNVIVVHMLGAFLCFAAGTIYFILQVSVPTTLLWIRRTVYLCLIFYVGKCKAIYIFISAYHRPSQLPYVGFCPRMIDYACSNRAMNKCIFIQCIWIHSVPSKLKRMSDSEA